MSKKSPIEKYEAAHAELLAACKGVIRLFGDYVKTVIGVNEVREKNNAKAEKESQA